MSNIVFSHIPKTGGTYTYRVLKSQKKIKVINLGHSNTLYNIPKNSISIACIRNPFDQLVSIYFHGGKGDSDGFGHINTLYNIKSFKEFIILFCKTDVFDKIKNFPLNNGMYNSIIKNNKCIIKYLIRFEYLDKGLEEFAKLHDIEFVFSDNYDKNTSNARPKGINNDYKKFYTKDMIKLVEKKFEKELKLFNYNFNGPEDNHAIIIT